MRNNVKSKKLHAWDIMLVIFLEQGALLDKLIWFQSWLLPGLRVVKEMFGAIFIVLHTLRFLQSSSLGLIS